MQTRFLQYNKGMEKFCFWVFFLNVVLASVCRHVHSYVFISPDPRYGMMKGGEWRPERMRGQTDMLYLDSTEGPQQPGERGPQEPQRWKQSPSACAAVQQCRTWWFWDSKVRV